MTTRSRSSKNRRHSGRVFPSSTLKCKKKFIIDNCLDPSELWDDWKDYRDGLRDRFSDGTRLKKYSLINSCRDDEIADKLIENNNKLKNESRIRKKRKVSR